MKKENKQTTKTTLSKGQLARDKHFTDLCYDTIEQPFYNFLQYNQWLYENVDLTKTEIDYINNYFFDFNVNPANFERKFHRVLSRALPTYHQLKNMELQDDIYKYTNNSYTRTIVNKTLNNLSSNGSGTNTQTNTNNGNVKNTGTQKNNGSSSQNTQTANKTLPMSVDDEGFDNLFNWSGASNVNENNTNGSSTDNTTTENTTIDTSSNTINGNTTNTLSNITNNDFNGTENYEQTNGLIVDIVKNIWAYLISKKAIDYLIEELKQCFILIY